MKSKSDTGWNGALVLLGRLGPLERSPWLLNKCDVTMRNRGLIGLPVERVRCRWRELGAVIF